MNPTTQLDTVVIEKIAAMSDAATVIQEKNGSFHLLVPAGYQHKDVTSIIESAQEAPHRKRGAIVLNDIESFNRYAADQGSNAQTYIYADPEARSLTAVFNDHDTRAELQVSPGWRDFRAVYTAELSREFTTWIKNNKQAKEQEDFAIFLEDNIADIMEPSGESLLAIALTLQAKTEVNFSSSRRLDNGQVQITYTENIDARAAAGSIDIPREFAIGCRLFKNGEGYKIRARLKYRLGGGKVKFWYELDRPENAIEDAFIKYIEKARETGFTVLIGKP